MSDDRRPTLINRASRAARPQFEVHRHTFVSGPRANGHYERDGQWHTGTFSHSHDGGHVGHEHPHTGPACYTIDKDDWFRTTGLRGGGRKTFTPQPTGEQFPIVALTPEQQTFEVRIVGHHDPAKGNGPGIALPARIAFAFKLRPIVIDQRPKRRRA